MIETTGWSARTEVSAAGGNELGKMRTEVGREEGRIWESLACQR